MTFHPIDFGFWSWTAYWLFSLCGTANTFLLFVIVAVIGHCTGVIV